MLAVGAQIDAGLSTVGPGREEGPDSFCCGGAVVQIRSAANSYFDY